MKLFIIICIVHLFYSVESNFLNLADHCVNPPTGNDSFYDFKISVMVPFEDWFKFSRLRVQPALEKALTDAERTIRSSNLPSLINLWESFNVSMDFWDTECDAETSIRIISDIQDMYSKDFCLEADGDDDALVVNVVLGMTCDYAAGRVATLGNHWNWTLIYPGTRTHSFDDKPDSACCSTMVRPGVTRSNIGKFIANFYKRYDWNTSVVVYSKANSHSAPVDKKTKTDCSTIVAGITDAFRAEGWGRYDYYNFTDRNNDIEIEEDLNIILQDIKNHARVSVWCVGRRTMRRVMKAAKMLNMTNGDFAFIYTDLYNTNSSYFWTDDDDHLEHDTSNSTNDPINITKIHTDDYLRGLTVVTLKTPSTEEYRLYSDYIKEKIKINSNEQIAEYNEYINPFISYYYDAMMTLLYGIMNFNTRRGEKLKRVVEIPCFSTKKSLFQTGRMNIELSICIDPSSAVGGVKFAEHMWGIELESNGRMIYISPSGDQLMDYSVLDMNNQTNKFEIVMNYFGHNDTWNELKGMDWPGTKPPVNIPFCGYRNEFCQEEIMDVTNYTLFYVLIACFCVLLIFSIIMGILYRRIARERNLQKMMWKIRWDDIDWTNTKKRNSLTGSMKDSCLSIASSNAGNQIFFAKQIFTKIGLYKDEVVAVKEIKRKRVFLDRSLLIDLQEVYALDHQHICKFIGAVIESPHVSILTEYCARGSLQDLLYSDYNMEDVFKKSLLSDIIDGMQYLHRSYFKCHGNLKSSNCLIDSRFLVKLTDFGLSKLREGARTDSITGFKYYENKLWTSPELLRGLKSSGTPKGDVYSFAIIAQEIIYRKGVFYTVENLSPQDILLHLTCPRTKKFSIRPTLDDDDTVVVDKDLKSLVKECWAADPQQRPDFNEIQKKFKKMKHDKNLVDSLLKRLENYSMHLEEKVEERTEQYRSEKERADTLLYQMLPEAVAEQLKKGNNVLPMAFENVTIFFSDIVGFTAISHDSQPMQVVNMLNDLYTMFDRIIDKYDVYKVETIGDAYMVVSGLPQKNGNRHAREIARMSLALIRCVKNEFKIRHMPDKQLKLRVGIHTGPVVAGVVGLKMPRYCLFGDTVNTASRMESNSKELSIHVSPKTKEILDYFGTFELEQRAEEVFLKGLGMWKTWWLVGESFLNNEASSEYEEESEDNALTVAANTNGSIITFESESPMLRNQLMQSSHLRDIGANSLSPNSIMKGRRRLSSVNESQEQIREPEKRHRLGTINSVRLHDLECSSVQSNRKARINQLNNELAAESDAEDNIQLSIRLNRKVKFNNASSGQIRNQTDNISRICKIGRDSGIGMSFENPSCADDPTAEDDYL